MGGEDIFCNLCRIRIVVRSGLYMGMVMSYLIGFSCFLEIVSTSPTKVGENLSYCTICVQERLQTNGNRSVR